MMSDQMKCIDPTTLEVLIMLDENSDWKRDVVIRKPEAVEIAEYQSDDNGDDFRGEVDFDV